MKGFCGSASCTGCCLQSSFSRSFIISGEPVPLSAIDRNATVVKRRTGNASCVANVKLFGGRKSTASEPLNSYRTYWTSKLNCFDEALDETIIRKIISRNAQERRKKFRIHFRIFISIVYKFKSCRSSSIRFFDFIVLNSVASCNYFASRDRSFPRRIEKDGDRDHSEGRINLSVYAARFSGEKEIEQRAMQKNGGE